MAGRPTKYSEKILKQAKDYVKNFRRYGDVIPTVEGLALILKVNRDTIYEWKKNYPEFSDTLEQLTNKQVKVLINAGLLGKINVAMAKLLLAKQGYSEKMEVNEEKKILILGVEDEIENNLR